jgi:hypothetical protein
MLTSINYNYWQLLMLMASATKGACLKSLGIYYYWQNGNASFFAPISVLLGESA